MKRLCFFFIFTVNLIFAQISFEKGYYIDNQNNKKEVFIKNGDWLNNPVEFFYKETSNSKEMTGKISEVKEFGVYNYNKLVRQKVDIDYSSDNISNLSSDRNPNNINKEVFLYELINGKLSLFVYREKDLVRFFYSENNDVIIPLVYKRYNPEADETRMLTNNTYKDQLKKMMADNDALVKKLIMLDIQKRT